MGLEAVGAAFRESHRLGEKHAARSLLVWMAFQVLDKPRDGRPALTFWAGYRTAAIGLGYPPTETEDGPRADAALTAVKRTMRDLEAAGLVKQLRRAARGRAAEWQLTLDPREPLDQPSSRSKRGGRRPTGTEVEDRPESGRRPTGTEVEDRPESGRRPTPLSVGPDRPEGAEHIGRARARNRQVDQLEMEASA